MVFDRTKLDKIICKVVQFCFILNYLQLSKGCKPLLSESFDFLIFFLRICCKYVILRHETR